VLGLGLGLGLGLKFGLELAFLEHLCDNSKQQKLS